MGFWIPNVGAGKAVNTHAQMLKRQAMQRWLVFLEQAFWFHYSAIQRKTLTIDVTSFSFAAPLQDPVPQTRAVPLTDPAASKRIRGGRYRVELSHSERAEFATLLSRGKPSARKLKRAQILVAAAWSGKRLSRPPPRRGQSHHHSRPRLSGQNQPAVGSPNGGNARTSRLYQKATEGGPQHKVAVRAALTPIRPVKSLCKGRGFVAALQARQLPRIFCEFA